MVAVVSGAARDALLSGPLSGAALQLAADETSVVSAKRSAATRGDESAAIKLVVEARSTASLAAALFSPAGPTISWEHLSFNLDVRLVGPSLSARSRTPPAYQPPD